MATCCTPTPERSCEQPQNGNDRTQVGDDRRVAKLAPVLDAVALEGLPVGEVILYCILAVLGAQLLYTIWENREP